MPCRLKNCFLFFISFECFSFREKRGALSKTENRRRVPDLREIPTTTHKKKLLPVMLSQLLSPLALSACSLESPCL